MLRRLDDNMAVAGQISPQDVTDLVASGIRLIINNRPDGEEPGQPPASAIEAAAAEAGIGYRYVPVAQLTPKGIDAMEAALGAADGPVLAFCRSGTRSTYLWALARNRMGEDAEVLVGKAVAAGYDLTPIRRFLR